MNAIIGNLRLAGAEAGELVDHESVAGTELQRPFLGLDGLVAFAAHVEGIGKGVEEGGVVRPGRDGRACQLDRLGQLLTRASAEPCQVVLLTGLAEYFAATGDYEQAEALCSYVTSHKSAWYEMKRLVQQVHQEISGSLSNEALANAQLRFAEQDPELVIFELLQILLPTE